MCERDERCIHGAKGGFTPFFLFVNLINFFETSNVWLIEI